MYDVVIGVSKFERGGTKENCGYAQPRPRCRSIQICFRGQRGIGSGGEGGLVNVWEIGLPSVQINFLIDAGDCEDANEDLRTRSAVHL